MDKIDLSRIPKFKTGEFVKIKEDRSEKVGFIRGLSKVGVVHNNTGIESCWVKFPNKEPIPLSENNLRRITFREFALYRDPNTGRWKIGKNGALPIVFSLSLSIAFIIASLSVEGPWKLAPILISLGIILVNYLGLRYNFTKRWV